MMPDMNGYEVCQQLKADAATRDIPVIFLTALTDMEDEKKGLELGAVDYITKPVIPPIVMARINTHLALKATFDLEAENRWLLATVKTQAKEIRALEKHYPGISAVNRDEKGRLVLPEFSEAEMRELFSDCEQRYGVKLTSP